MNGMLNKSKFHSLKIILDYGASPSIVLGKHAQKLCNKNNKAVKWSTQVSDFQKNYTINVVFVLLELDATNIVMWNF